MLMGYIIETLDKESEITVLVLRTSSYGPWLKRLGAQLQSRDDIDSSIRDALIFTSKALRLKYDMA